MHHKEYVGRLSDCPSSLSSLAHNGASVHTVRQLLPDPEVSVPASSLMQATDLWASPASLALKRPHSLPHTLSFTHKNPETSKCLLSFTAWQACSLVAAQHAMFDSQVVTVTTSGTYPEDWPTCCAAIVFWVTRVDVPGSPGEPWGVNSPQKSRDGSASVSRVQQLEQLQSWPATSAWDFIWLNFCLREAEAEGSDIKLRHNAQIIPAEKRWLLNVMDVNY